MRLVLRAAVVAAALALPATAAADTTVDSSFSGTCARDATCKTISDAVAAAQAGDTIVVKPGAYAEDVTVPAGKDGLTIKGDAAGVAVSGSVSVASANVTLFKMAIARTTGTDPALTISGSGAKLVELTVVNVGGNGVQISGGAQIQRSLIAGAAGDGIHVETTTGDHAVKVDSTIALGGPTGAAIAGITTGAASGTLTLTVRHVTAPETNNLGIKLDSSAAVGLLNPSGNIVANVSGSIIHGANGATARNFTTPVELGARSNTITVKYTNSDANTMTGTSKQLIGDDNTNDKSPQIDMGGATPTADVLLFDKNFRLLPSSPVKDKGGAVIDDESTTDIDGEARSDGAATDMGADEFVNKAPEVKGVTLDPAAPKSGQVVTFTATASDPNSGDAITYGFNFGDGTEAVITASNVVQHLFSDPGTYNVQVAAVDSLGTPSQIFPLPVTVGDGRAPFVKITSHKLLVKRHELRIRGAVNDPSGVAKVEIALTRSAGCQQYNGQGFARQTKATCNSSRQFIEAMLVGGTRFEITTNPDVKIPKGKYVLRARATDKVGNVTTKFTTKAGSLVKLTVP